MDRARQPREGFAPAGPRHRRARADVGGDAERPGATVARRRWQQSYRCLRRAKPGPERSGGTSPNTAVPFSKNRESTHHVEAGDLVEHELQAIAGDGVARGEDLVAVIRAQALGEDHQLGAAPHQLDARTLPDRPLQPVVVVRAPVHGRTVSAGTGGVSSIGGGATGGGGGGGGLCAGLPTGTAGVVSAGERTEAARRPIPSGRTER